MKVQLIFMMSRVKKSSVADCDRAPPRGASGASLTASSKLESLADIRCANNTAILSVLHVY